ncbi:PI-stichotoxin-Hcr2e-like [Tachypleus tridentatus]|uniref:PI-stichotoxin-Hcr2e-like n=1 Tax=Tachypleus tridentatus TaxID=6853 RepID=UPI003FD57D78
MYQKLMLLLLVTSLCSFSVIAGFDCWSKPDPGPCYAYFTRYYYDPGSHRCKSFIYGGLCGKWKPLQNKITLFSCLCWNVTELNILGKADDNEREDDTLCCHTLLSDVSKYVCVQ